MVNGISHKEKKSVHGVGNLLTRVTMRTCSKCSFRTHPIMIQILVSILPINSQHFRNFSGGNEIFSREDEDERNGGAEEKYLGNRSGDCIGAKRKEAHSNENDSGSKIIQSKQK